MLPTLVLCAVVAIIVLIIKSSRTEGPPRGNDAPFYSKSLPIIGITHKLLLLDNIKLWDFFKEMIKDVTKKGGVVKERFALNSYYVITDPEDALTVSNVCLNKLSVYRFAECVYGQSIILAPAPKWKINRKLLNPAYSLSVIHGFIDIFNDQAKQLVDEVKCFVGKKPTKLTSLIENNILRGVCLTTFGGNNLHDKKTFETYLDAIDGLSHLIINRIQKFWLHNDFIFWLSGQKKKTDELVSTMTQISNEIINKVQKARANEQVPSSFDDRQIDVRTLLDLYLNLNADNTLSMEELREELEIAIAAAFDTTSSQLEFLLILLGSYPEIQEKVYKEVIDVLGESKNVEKDDLRKLVYTEAVIKESLRFLPGSPIIGRLIDQDVKLKNCTLRKGTQAILIIYGINRDSSWGPDADQFRPERWLEPGGVPDIPSAFATFSFGKRSCIGKTYALILLKITVAHLIRKYRIQADYNKMLVKFVILLKPAKGNEITLWHRKTS